MAGSNYERQSSLTNGITINASLFNSEFNQLLNAFRYSSTDSAATGHRHDGAAGQGANIYRVGDTDFKNKIEVDETNNRHGFFVEVGAAAVEQVRIQDGAVVPVTTNDIDLGSSSLEFKNIYARNFVSSTGVNVNGGLTVALNTNLTVGTTLTMSSDGTDTTINEIGDGKLLVGANEYIFRTSDGTTSAVDATPTELNRMILSSGDNGGVFIYGGNASPVATDTTYVNHTAAFYNTGGLALRSPASISNGGWFSCQNSITITDVDDGTESFPDIHLKRNSPSPADADNLGSIEFWGNRVGGTTAASKYGQIRAQIEDVETGVGKIVLLPHDGTGQQGAVGFSMGTFQYSGVDGAATNTKAGGVLRLTSADDTTLELSALDTNVFLMSGGLDVTGDVAATTVTVGDSTGTNLELYEDSSQNAIIRQRGAGGLQISGLNGSLSNDNYEQLLSWDTDNVNLRWQGASGAGTKLATTETGIDVTGTVAASDGLTADYIDLTGGKSTTTTGAICADQIRFSAETSDEAKIYASVDGLNTSLFIQSADDVNDKVRVVAGGTESLTVSKTGIEVTGTVTADGLTLGAGEIATFNSHDGGDLQISGSATGSFSLIKQTGGGDLFIQGQNGFLKNDTGNALVSWYADHPELSWQGATGAGIKLATTETGVDVTGTITADGVSLGDNEQIQLGAAQDLKIFHNGVASVIQDNGTGNLYIQGSSAVNITNVGSSETYASFNENGAVNLYHDNASKFATTETGIDVTGIIDCNNSLQIRSTGSNVDAMPDLYMSNLEGAAAAQNLGMISFRGYNLATTPEITNYADVYAQQVVVTDGAEEGKLVFDVLGAGAKVEALQVTKDGIDVTGNVAADGVSLANDKRITLGAESGTNYLEIFESTAGNGVIKQVGAGDFAIQGHAIQIKDDDGNLRFQGTNGSAGNAFLYYGADATPKLNTVSTGINVTGTVTADAIKFTTDATDDAQIFTELTGTTTALIIQSKDDGDDSIVLRSHDAGVGQVDVLVATKTGIDVTGNLDVQGTITSNAFAHSKALVVETGSLSTSEFLAHAGKRIVKTGATTSVYSLPQPVAADIGKTWIIANASGTKATIDHDASGTAQNIWILDGVTLTAKEADWELKKGSITEIACVAAEAAGGSAAAANYIIYGAGVIEV